MHPRILWRPDPDLDLESVDTIGDESVPIQLAQCLFPGWPFPTLKYRHVFQIIYTEAILSNNTRELLRFEISKMLIAFKINKFIVLFIILFGTLSFPMGYHAIKYDTTRWAILTCTLKRYIGLSQLNLSQGTKKFLKKSKTRKRICSKVSVNSHGSPWNQSRRRKRRLRWQGFVEKEGFKLGVKGWGSWQRLFFSDFRDVGDRNSLFPITRFTPTIYSTLIMLM